MRDRLRVAYGWLRTLPLAGVLASRLVWAAKGALGRPVVAPERIIAPPRRREDPPPPDIRLAVALAAVQALGERLSVLESGLQQAGLHSPPAPVGAADTVSVIVSTLDRAAWLDRALTALAYQRHPAFEIIVVAGPCRDETSTVLARHAQRIRTIACKVANLSVARNMGLGVARGDVVAFLDDDAVPEADWLERLCTAYADPQVGGAGGFIRDHTGLTYQCKVVVADRYGRSHEVGKMPPARLGLSASDGERYLSLTGTNSSFRRRALQEIGGFDKAYAYFLDETDVCLRLVEAGWRLTVVSDAEVHHAYAPSARRRIDHTPKSLLACARSTAYFALRNAAPRYGLLAAADYLHVYAEGLRRDTRWRRDRGLLTDEDAERQLADVDQGVTRGAHEAFGGPRRLLTAAAADRAGSRAFVSGTPTIRTMARRLKLCLLSQEYPGEGQDLRPPGGVAVWTQALAQALAADGHEVTVLTRAGSADPEARFQAEDGAGVWVHRIAGLVTTRASRRGALPSALALGALPSSVAAPALAAAMEVTRIDARRAFDLVMGPLWDLEPIAMFGRVQCPVAVSLHTSFAQMATFKPEWDEDYRRTHVDKIIAGERRLLAQATHVLANSHAAADDIGAALGLANLAARAVVIPHGLPDLALGVETPDRDAGTEILFVGRLERRKGVETLLSAAAEVLAAAPEARLVIVGEDVRPRGEPYGEAFQRRYAGATWLDRVRFTGPLSRSKLLARYAACDLVVVPSLYESFGLTALEAMIFGKPCVASGVGGLGELVVHGKTGLLAGPGDPTALAAAVLAMVRSREMRCRMGAAGRARYKAHFTAAGMARAVEAWVWESVKAPSRLAAE